MERVHVMIAQLAAVPQPERGNLTSCVPILAELSVGAACIDSDSDADNQDSHAGGRPDLTTTTTKKPAKNTSHSTRGIINRLLRLFSASACWQISSKTLKECVKGPCTVNSIHPPPPLVKFKPWYVYLEGLFFHFVYGTSPYCQSPNTYT